MHTEKEHILLCQHLDIFSDCERGILMHFVFYVKANVSLTLFYLYTFETYHEGVMTRFDFIFTFR